MVDASTQTELECHGNTSHDNIPQLENGKWKDNLFVRYMLEPPSKKLKN